MRAAVYLRQSKDDHDTGLAIERQREDCLKLCETRGWTPVPYVDSKISAYSGKRRPAYEQMLSDIAAGKLDAVVAWDLDRLHRRPIELERFMEMADQHRLALAARAMVHGEEVEHCGPVLASKTIEGDKVILTFDHAKGGLTAKEGALTGFTVAGDDRKFVRAMAEIDGNKIVVSSPDVKKPVAVRFGWANFPVVNLFNKADLPATPFRTDDFPGVTQPK